LLCTLTASQSELERGLRIADRDTANAVAAERGQRNAVDRMGISAVCSPGNSLASLADSYPAAVGVVKPTSPPSQAQQTSQLNLTYLLPSMGI